MTKQYRKAFLVPLSIFTIFTPLSIFAQSWTLWASGLPAGTFPKMTIAPNHDIFYTLVGTSVANAGLVFKANTAAASGSFTALTTLPFPSSHVNNINALGYNANNEPIVGIFRNTISEPFLFRYDNSTSNWVAATVTNPPTLGAYCMVTAPNGAIYVGGRWANVYKSTDNGSTYSRIDESAILGAAYPCYYPSWLNVASNAAIYGINMDKNGRLYVGSESAGVVYSDDGGTSWHPADFFACQSGNPTQKNGASPMKPLSNCGNVAALGFTASNNLVWTRSSFWDDNWTNGLGYADMTAHTVTQCTGFSTYLITTGQQISKIVTTTNGKMFLHSGGPVNNPPADVGIFTSTNGIQWTAFNTGITGLNDGQSQGSLAVDGNLVFYATHDGKVFRYDAATTVPLELLNFSGHTEGGKNVLTWQTANEINASHFDIERSADGKTFEKISQVKTKGSNSTYEFLDETQTLKRLYYRLRINDLDTKSEFSKIISLENSKILRGVKMYPNPVKDVLIIELNALSNTSITVNLLDIGGKVVATKNHISDTPTSSFSFDTRLIPNGIYTAMVRLDGEKSVYKVVIAR